MRNHPLYVEPSAREWALYMARQRGSGSDDYYRGLQYQRGTGALGNIFRSVLSFAKPVAKQALKKVGMTGIKTALNVAQDALEGRNLGESLQSRGVEAGADLLQSARSRIGRPAARKTKRRRPKQRGRGLGTRLSTVFKRRNKSIKAVRRKPKRTKKRLDIFS